MISVNMSDQLQLYFSIRLKLLYQELFILIVDKTYYIVSERVISSARLIASFSERVKHFLEPCGLLSYGYCLFLDGFNIPRPSGVLRLWGSFSADPSGL